MRIILIAAASTNNVIGNRGKLPWRLPNELKHFKDRTHGKPVIMGRKTAESIGRVLPDRKNIVLTRDPAYVFEGMTICHSKEDALSACKDAEDVYIIGGSSIYSLFLDDADAIELTRVHQEIEGDAFFPEILHENWEIVQEDGPHEEEGWRYTYLIYQRK